MTTVESRVVDPVPSHTSVDVSQSDMVDEALTHDEEEKMMEDEEIESCEEDVEEQMISVAIMNSVVESTVQPVKSEMSPHSARYGLRKRPRPSDSPETGNHDAILLKPARSVLPRATIKNGRLSLVAPTDMGELHTQPPGTEVEMPKLKQEPLSGGMPSILSIVTPSTGEDTIIDEVPRPTQQLIAPNIPIKTEPEPLIPLMQHEAPPSSAAVLSRVQNKVKKTPSPKQENARQAPRPNSPTTSFQSVPMNSLLHSSRAVPNPLSQSTPPHTSHPVKTKVKEDPNAVPCPLPPSVPCPLETPAPEEHLEKRVTIVEPPVPLTRSRIFSVDLDPSTFDFPDMSGDHNDMEKTDDDIGDLTGDNAQSDDLAIFKRDRAFSFEFFTFAGDDLLPAPPSSSAPSSSLPDSSDTDDFITGRPRGDSIIFDPVSFQDGGIHEKNAIIKVNAAKEIDATPPALFADSRLAAPPVAVVGQTPRPIAAALPASAPPTSHQISHPTSPPSTENGQLVTLPSALSVPDANGNTSGTFQMELLNKDGRIGIYLPDARRARIARFHAKRKMRIWRKRIKYDCRKKLADSRPRIKGRFVKRSDMDE